MANLTRSPRVLRRTPRPPRVIPGVEHGAPPYLPGIAPIRYDPRMWRLSLFLAVSGLCGQTLFSVRVEAVPAGAPFSVDGVRYTQGQAFIWQEGTRHVLAGEGPPSGQLPPSIYSFQTWTDSARQLNSPAMTVEVTASQQVRTYTATYQLSHTLNVRFEAGAGTVTANTTTFTSEGSVYIPNGTTVALNAVPSPGWLFTRWNHRNEPPASPVTSFTMTAPTVLHPIFARAAQVTLRTEPADVELSADGTPAQSPWSTQWAFGETYRLSARSPQTDALGRLWVFDQWDMGGGDVRTSSATLYQVSGSLANRTLTARFVRGATARFETVPFGLRLNIDGRENWLSYVFVWGVGSTHTVIAPAEQTDSKGARWRFKGWRHGGAAAQTFTVNDSWTAAENLRVAEYEPMAPLRIDTAPAGLTASVAGADCRTPCTHWAMPGSAVEVRVPRSIPLAGGSRMDFTGWRDGGDADRVVRVTAAGESLLANFVRMHPVRGEVQPENAGTIAGLTGFAAEGSALNLESMARPGFRLKRWEGDAMGTATTARLTVRGPVTVRAVMEAAAWVDPRGVQNAVELTEEPWIAPGSRAAITGFNLAEKEVLATSNPLPQFLAGVSVSWEAWLLPLLSVSPERLEVAIPWGMPPGMHQLTVRRVGMAEVKAVARVRPVAPALFPNFVPQADGSIVLLATGLGPVTRTPLDGFAVPAGMTSTTISPVEVVSWSASTCETTESSGCGQESATTAVAELAQGHVGLFGVRVRLPAGADQVRLRVDGFSSNPIRLAGPEVEQK